jgi:ferredoxin
MGRNLLYRLEQWLGYTPALEFVQDLGAAGYLRWLPPLPGLLKRWHGTAPPKGPRSLEIPPLPARLRTAAGIPRDPAGEEAAFKNGPLPTWISLQPKAVRLITSGNWMSTLWFTPSRARSARKMMTAPTRLPGIKPQKTSPEELSRALKERAAAIGLSAIGVAVYDPKYTWAQFVNAPDTAEIGHRVIVCVLEQNWEATQTIPSVRAERSASHAYAKMGPMVHELAAHVRSLGYAAKASEGTGRAISIHYGVEAGLGQLGLNGQLLTPFAGSRCRLMLIHTDAPLAVDSPKDYGIPAICDECKACVRRCPSGAIPSTRQFHRGVYKIKIKTERCVPMLAQAHTCGVCMKVCPVQKYGLPAVLQEYERSGTVLGKGTDDLEGYDWPVDGRHYGPGEKPKSAVTEQGLHPRGWVHQDPADQSSSIPALGSRSWLSKRLRPLREEWIEPEQPDL